jgi:hypothetical protein
MAIAGGFVITLDKRVKSELEALDLELQKYETSVVDDVVAPSVESSPEVTAPSVHIEQNPLPTNDVPEVAQDVAYWQARAAAIKAAQDESARPKEDPELAKLREQAARAAELEARIAELTSRLEAPKDQGVALDPEFAEAYPDVAEQIKKAALSVRAELQSSTERTVNEMRAQLQEQAKRISEERKQATLAEHFAAVKAVHPDASDFFTESLNPAWTAWASEKSPIVSQIIRDPASFDPRDVVWAISEFKREAGMTAKSKAKPVVGDLAVKVGSPSQVAGGPQPDDSLTDAELANFDALVREAQRLPEAEREARFADLMRRLDNSAIKTLRGK